MLIDRSHRLWFIGSTASLVVLAVVYAGYYALSPQASRGGSPLGILYGVVGFGFMIFAGLLSLRKKFPIWRIGRAQTWMRAHLWLGFLSFPILVLHGGFHFGGGLLTRVMMWLFLFVFVSGVLGAALQHFMPRVATAQLPMETIYEQIDRVREQLVGEATAIVEAACSTLQGNLTKMSQAQRSLAASAGTMGGLTVASGLQLDQGASAELQRYFEDEIVPFLKAAKLRGQRLSDPRLATNLFRQLRILLPPALHPAVEDLESICEEKRQLDLQRRLHWVLHGWLLVHIPASYAVLLLGAVHAVVALRY